MAAKKKAAKAGAGAYAAGKAVRNNEYVQRLVEATLPRPERTGMRGHLTAGEAGGQAKGAGAKRLLLVHISDELDAEEARAHAAEAFGGPVEVAVEGATFDV